MMKSDLQKNTANQTRSEAEDLELKDQVKHAFDQVKLPDDVRVRTLQAIEAMRNEQNMATAAASTAEMSTSEANATNANADAPALTLTLTRNPRRTSSKKRIVSLVCGIAACFAFALVGVFGFRYATEPTAYIDIDINPSIELAVNRFNNVVGAEAINDDAKAILDRVDVVGKPYPNAVEELMNEIQLAGYSPNDSFVEFSISSDDVAQTADLETTTDSFIATCGYNGACAVVDASVHAAAHAHNMGTGKYLAAQELTELDPSITIEDCSRMSMRQIRDHINACHQEADESTGTNNTGMPAGNGNGYGAGIGAGAGAGAGADNGYHGGAGNGTGAHHGAGHHRE